MCTNINCEILFIDKTFLSQKIFDYIKRAHKFFEIFKIRKINDSSMFTFDYIFFKFRMLNVQTIDKSKINIFTRRIYVIKNLKTKFFMNYNILNFEKLMINVNKTNLIIDLCKNFKIQFNVTNIDSSIKWITKINKIVKISIKFLIIISFKFRNKNDLSTKRDFMFYFVWIAKLKIEKKRFISYYRYFYRNCSNLKYEFWRRFF